MVILGNRIMFFRKWKFWEPALYYNSVLHLPLLQVQLSDHGEVRQRFPLLQVWLSVHCMTSLSWASHCYKFDCQSIVWHLCLEPPIVTSLTDCPLYDICLEPPILTSLTHCPLYDICALSLPLLQVWLSVHCMTSVPWASHYYKFDCQSIVWHLCLEPPINTSLTVSPLYDISVLSLPLLQFWLSVHCMTSLPWASHCYKFDCQSIGWHLCPEPPITTSLGVSPLWLGKLCDPLWYVFSILFSFQCAPSKMGNNIIGFSSSAIGKFCCCCKMAWKISGLEANLALSYIRKSQIRHHNRFFFFN